MPDFNNELCDNCGGCAAVCPTNAITVFFDIIEVDLELCNDCLVCQKVCPVKAISKK